MYRGRYTFGRGRTFSPRTTATGARPPYRRYRVRRGPRRRYPSSTRGRVKQVERSVGKLKSLIETKHLDVVGSGVVGLVALASTPLNPLSFSALDSGLGVSDMVGTQVSWKNMYVRYSFQCGWDSTTNLPVTNLVRCLIVWHKQWNGQAVAYTLSEYLSISGVTPSTDMLQTKRWSNRKQFTVLHDKTYYMVDKDASTSHMGGSFKIPLKGRKTVYTADVAANNANIESGAIFAYLFTDNPASNAPVYYAFSTRLTYTDA